MCISMILALISCFFIHPDRQYIDYINFDVLILLFCLMAASAGFCALGIFNRLSDKLLELVTNSRDISLILMFLCFFSSMLITNDVALITFVPLTMIIFRKASSPRNLIYTVIAETVAANLGSMATPVGNPQNLYIYSHYKLSIMDFLKATLPFTIISLLLTGIFVRLKVSAVDIKPRNKKQYPPVNKKKLIAYLAIFLISILSVAQVVPKNLCFIITVVLLLIFSRDVFIRVDYTLLLTFVFFFIFVGNISRVPQINNIISSITQGNELVLSAVLSQGISNVPCAMMLSGFTDNYASLLVGVNIGGLGTPIASMASLISYGYYIGYNKKLAGAYMSRFLAVNLIMFAVLIFTAGVIFRY